MAFKVTDWDAIISRMSVERGGEERNSRMERSWREEGTSDPGVLNLDSAAV